MSGENGIGKAGMLAALLVMFGSAAAEPSSGVAGSMVVMEEDGQALRVTEDGRLATGLAGGMPRAGAVEGEVGIDIVELSRGHGMRVITASGAKVVELHEEELQLGGGQQEVACAPRTEKALPGAAQPPVETREVVSLEAGPGIFADVTLVEATDERSVRDKGERELRDALAQPLVLHGVPVQTELGIRWRLSGRTHQL